MSDISSWWNADTLRTDWMADTCGRTGWPETVTCFPVMIYSQRL